MVKLICAMVKTWFYNFYTLYLGDGHDTISVTIPQAIAHDHIYVYIYIHIHNYWIFMDCPSLCSFPSGSGENLARFAEWSSKCFRYGVDGVDPFWTHPFSISWFYSQLLTHKPNFIPNHILLYCHIVGGFIHYMTLVPHHISFVSPLWLTCIPQVYLLLQYISIINPFSSMVDD